MKKSDARKKTEKNTKKNMFFSRKKTRNEKNGFFHNPMHDVQNESLVFLYQLGTLSPLPSGEKEVSQTPHWLL